MHRARFVVLFVAIALVGAGCEWTQWGANPLRTGTTGATHFTPATAPQLTPDVFSTRLGDRTSGDGRRLRVRHDRRHAHGLRRHDAHPRVVGRAARRVRRSGRWRRSISTPHPTPCSSWSAARSRCSSASTSRGRATARRRPDAIRSSSPRSARHRLRRHRPSSPTAASTSTARPRCTRSTPPAAPGARTGTACRRAHPCGRR